MADASSAPEIAHIFPDFSGSHLQAESHPQHVVTGEGFDGEVEFFGWTPVDSPSSVDDVLARVDFESISPPASPPAGAKKIPLTHLENGVAVLPVRDRRVGLSGTHTVIWAVNKAGASAPYLVHVAKPFWLSEDSVQAGENMYLFGFGVRGKVALRGERGVVFGEPFVEARSPRHSDPNLVYFRIPSSTPPGTYQVYAHNGQGGIYGWRRAGDLKVKAAVKKEVKIFNVRDFGATGAGGGSELLAIRAAVKAAQDAGGGRVLFPPGTYRIDETLAVPADVELVGAGSEQSILEGIGFDPSEAKPESWAPTGAPFSVLIMADRSRLEKMGVQGSVSKGRGGYATIIGEQNPTSITIKHCKILGTEGDVETSTGRYRAALAFRDSKRMSILENDITGSIEMRPDSYRAQIINNTFRRGTLMDMCSIMIPGSKNLIDANRFIDTPGRLALFRGYRNYVRYNEMMNYGRGSWTNVPEPFLFHGGNDQRTGAVTSAAPLTLTDNSLALKDAQLTGATVLIYAGRGKGQYRIVKGNTSDTLQLESPWKVIPDKTSRYSVGMKILENGIYANQNHSPGYLALWLDCIGNVVEMHRDNNSLGIYVYGDDRSRVDSSGKVTNPGRYHPSWFNLISNNWEDGAQIRFEGINHPDNAYDGLALFANTVTFNKVRHPHQQRSPNVAHNIAVGGIRLDASAGKPSASHTMILGNLVSNTGVGVMITGETKATFLIGNRFHDVNQPLVAATGPVFSRDNVRETITERGQEVWIQADGSTDQLAFVKPEIKDAAPLKIIELHEVRRDGAGESGSENLALGKPVSGSFPNAGKEGALFTDGTLGGSLGSDGGPQFLQVDLGDAVLVARIRLWHHFEDRRSYRGVIIQLSDDPHFTKNVTTIFNNDSENLALLGAGSDPRYFETKRGLTIDFPPVRARYIRSWINGSNTNSYNHWVQLEAYGPAR